MLCLTGNRGHERGIPDELMKRKNHAMSIDLQLLPQTGDAVGQFESHGGTLTTFSEFGHDPLSERSDLIQQRETKFHERYTDFGPFFYSSVNGDNSIFRLGLLYFIEISTQLLSQIQ